MNEIRMKRWEMQIDFHFSEARKLSLACNKPNLNCRPSSYRMRGASLIRDSLTGEKYRSSLNAAINMFLQLLFWWIYLCLCYLRTSVVKIDGGTNRANDWTVCQLLSVWKQSIGVVIDNYVIFQREKKTFFYVFSFWMAFFLLGRARMRSVCWWKLEGLSSEGDSQCPDQLNLNVFPNCISQLYFQLYFFVDENERRCQLKVTHSV